MLTPRSPSGSRLAPVVLGRAVHFTVRLQETDEGRMTVKPIRVRFVEPIEIRMGSPYNACRVLLTGPWVPDLPDAGQGFQDVKAWSPSGEFLGLVQWDIPQNDPGFRVLVVGVRNQTLTRSRRVAGCCESLKWSADGFEYRAFVTVRGHVAAGEGTHA